MMPMLRLLPLILIARQSSQSRQAPVVVVEDDHPRTFDLVDEMRRSKMEKDKQYAALIARNRKVRSDRAERKAFQKARVAARKAKRA